MRILLVGIMLMMATGAGYGLWKTQFSSREPGSPERLELRSLLGGDNKGYARVLAPRPLRIPSDFGAHPDFRNEWWYLTGNLSTPGGRRFGFEFTVFRIALSPHPVRSPSAWATRQAYMAHFAVTDIMANRFYAYQRLERGAIGLAGVSNPPFKAWVDDWWLAGTRDPFPLRLQASEKGTAIRLTLQCGDGLLLQGSQGFSRKGPRPGNASFYYSYPRLSASGSVTVRGHRYKVGGAAWLDHEWSTSALGPDEVGWDWFGLQLDDGTDLTIYRLRRRDGSSGRFSAGTWRASGGRVFHLGARDFRLRPLAYWSSPKSRVRYPLRWRIDIPDRKAVITVSAAIPGQELNLAVRYWEGAVNVRADIDGRAVGGVGYLELTG